jgi:hypothetical protein
VAGGQQLFPYELEDTRSDRENQPLQSSLLLPLRHRLRATSTVAQSGVPDHPARPTCDRLLRTVLAKGRLQFQHLQLHLLHFLQNLHLVPMVIDFQAADPQQEEENSRKHLKNMLRR